MKKLAFIILSLALLIPMAAPSYAFMGQKPQVAPKPAPTLPGSTGVTPSADKNCNPDTADWVTISCADHGTYLVCRMQNTCSGEQRAVTVQKRSLPGNPYGGRAQ